MSLMASLQIFGVEIGEILDSSSARRFTRSLPHLSALSENVIVAYVTQLHLRKVKSRRQVPPPKIDKAQYAYPVAILDEIFSSFLRRGGNIYVVLLLYE